MKRMALKSTSIFLALACFAALAFALKPPAPPTLSIVHGWVRWLPANLPAAGYATIRNDGKQPIKLTGADSPDYAMVMLHRSMQKNGQDMMMKVDGIAVPARGSVRLAPGGYHLMLMHPKHAIKPGDSVRLSLHFSDGKTLQATWPVRPANASGAGN